MSGSSNSQDSNSETVLDSNQFFEGFRGVPQFIQLVELSTDQREELLAKLNELIDRLSQYTEDQRNQLRERFNPLFQLPELPLKIQLLLLLQLLQGLTDKGLQLLTEMRELISQLSLLATNQIEKLTALFDVLLSFSQQPSIPDLPLIPPFPYLPSLPNPFLPGITLPPMPRYISFPLPLRDGAVNFGTQQQSLSPLNYYTTPLFQALPAPTDWVSPEPRVEQVPWWLSGPQLQRFPIPGREI